jgi:sigma-54 specific flagellar transcriptional regulator A
MRDHDERFALESAFHGMVGRGAAMRVVFEKIDRYGVTDAPVLITGETGTGKELIARAVHRVSPRRQRPFVAINCSALNEDLFESELFGHDRGAFTGAVATHKGRFERANLGSLFLDEIGDMPERVQAKLLRVLEHGTFERVGGEREISADVRIIAATNVGLERAVGEGRFREDLYHRVAVLRIHAPPLRERVDDLPLLVDHFLRQFAGRYGRPVARLSPEAMHAFEQYAWPGNVRELRNVLERLFVESRTEVIGRGALNEWVQERDLLAAGAWNVELRDRQQLSGRVLVPGGADDVSADDLRRAAMVLGRLMAESAPPERRLPSDEVAGEDDGVPIVRVAAEVRGAGEEPEPPEITEESLRDAYRAARGNLSAAARRLRVHKATLYRHMKRLGLSRDDLAEG